MVWFQCEVCGENLKKPKLLNHFNRCSAYKLSCIDCGVVFDQQSVQVHTSCVTEVEKYGPKGINGAFSKTKNAKDTIVSDVDTSVGLSTCPPWSCSLCNVKATSKETLELHAQGKKHRSKAKAIQAKAGIIEKIVVTQDGTDGSVKASNLMLNDQSQFLGKDAANSASNCEPQSMGKEELFCLNEECVSPNKDKKRKKGQADGADVKTVHFEKTQSCGIVASEKVEPKTEFSGTVLKEIKVPDPKRQKCSENAVEEFNEATRQTGVSSVESGHNDEELETVKILHPSSKGERSPTRENGLKKGKKRRTDILVTNGNTITSESKGQARIESQVENGNRALEHRKEEEKKRHKEKHAMTVDAEVSERKQQEAEEDDGKVADLQEEVQHNYCKRIKGKKRSKSEKKDSLSHEVSFREWLGGDGGPEGMSSSPQIQVTRQKGKQMDRVVTMEEIPHKPLEKQGKEPSHFGIGKVVKWKKIIRGVLRRALNGRLKTKDLKKVVLPLAQKAVAESSAVSVDKKSLKAELMRQVSSSGKFLVDGNHVMLAPVVK